MNNANVKNYDYGQIGLLVEIWFLVGFFSYFFFVKSREAQGFKKRHMVRVIQKHWKREVLNE